MLQTSAMSLFKMTIYTLTLLITHDKSLDDL